MFRSRAASSGIVAFLRAGGRAASSAGVVADAPSMVGAATFGRARLLAAGAPPNARHLSARFPAHALGLGALTESTNRGALAASSPRLLAAGAPANPVAGLLAAARARTHAVASAVDIGSLAAASGAPTHAVAALDISALAAAAYGPEFGTETLTVVLLAEDLGALAVAAGAPAHAAAAIDLGVLAAAHYGQGLRAGEMTAAASARLLAAGAPADPVVRLLAAASARPNALVPAMGIHAFAAAAGAPAHVVAALDMGAFAASGSAPAHVVAALDMGAFAAAARAPAHVVAALDFATLGAAAYGPEVVSVARPSRSRIAANGGMFGTIFGRTGGVPVRGGCGIRMLCTATGGGGGEATAAVLSTAATKAELNDLRAEVLQHYLKAGKETNKIWDEINALRVKTLDAAIAGVMEMVKQNGEKTEALAATVAAAEKRQHEERARELERREKVMAEREKLEEQKRAARWF